MKINLEQNEYSALVKEVKNGVGGELDKLTGNKNEGKFSN